MSKSSLASATASQPGVTLLLVDLTGTVSSVSVDPGVVTTLEKLRQHLARKRRIPLTLLALQELDSKTGADVGPCIFSTADGGQGAEQYQQRHLVPSSSSSSTSQLLDFLKFSPEPSIAHFRVIVRQPAPFRRVRALDPEDEDSRFVECPEELSPHHFADHYRCDLHRETSEEHITNQVYRRNAGKGGNYNDQYMHSPADDQHQRNLVVAQHDDCFAPWKGATADALAFFLCLTLPRVKEFLCCYPKWGEDLCLLSFLLRNNAKNQFDVARFRAAAAILDHAPANSHLFDPTLLVYAPSGVRGGGMIATSAPLGSSFAGVEKRLGSRFGGGGRRTSLPEDSGSPVASQGSSHLVNNDCILASSSISLRMFEREAPTLLAAVVTNPLFRQYTWTRRELGQPRESAKQVLVRSFGLMDATKTRFLSGKNEKVVEVSSEEHRDILMTLVRACVQKSSRQVLNCAVVGGSSMNNSSSAARPQRVTGSGLGGGNPVFPSVLTLRTRGCSLVPLFELPFLMPTAHLLLRTREDALEVRSFFLPDVFAGWSPFIACIARCGGGGIVLSNNYLSSGSTTTGSSPAFSSEAPASQSTSSIGLSLREKSNLKTRMMNFLKRHGARDVRSTSAVFWSKMEQRAGALFKETFEVFGQKQTMHILKRGENPFVQFLQSPGSRGETSSTRITSLDQLDRLLAGETTAEKAPDDGSMSGALVVEEAAVGDEAGAAEGPRENDASITKRKIYFDSATFVDEAEEQKSQPYPQGNTQIINNEEQDDEDDHLTEDELRVKSLEIWWDRTRVPVLDFGGVDRGLLSRDKSGFTIETAVENGVWQVVSFRLWDMLRHLWEPKAAAGEAEASSRRIPRTIAMALPEDSSDE